MKKHLGLSLSLAAALLCSAPGCDDADPPDHDTQVADGPAATDAPGGKSEAGQTKDGAAKKAFGDPCNANDQCATHICHKFGDGTQACTRACKQNSDCPAGSQGQKCNGQGVCRT
jgi:hypothetical protein